MKFIIDKRAEVPAHKDVYVLAVKLMHGDADSHETLEWRYRKDQEGELEAGITLLDKFIKDGGGGDNKELQNELAELTGSCLPGDCTNDGNTRAAVEGYKLFWHDAEGARYGVAIKK